MRVSSPHGRSCTNSAWATCSASSTSASVASGRPSVRFSRTLIEKSVASSNAVATTVRSWASGRSRTSTPSRVTRPAVTSKSRPTSAVSVVLPEPVAPTRATVSPGRDVEVDAVEHRPVGARVGEADALEAQPGGGADSAADDARPVGDGDRRVEQLADPVAGAGGLLREGEQEAQRQDRPQQHGEQRDERRPARRRSARRCSRPAHPPTRITARVTCGCNSKTHHSSARVRTLSSSSRAQPGRLARRSGRRPGRLRPSDLTTRMPCTASSTSVASSPCSSWTSRGLGRCTAAPSAGRAPTAGRS